MKYEINGKYFRYLEVKSLNPITKNIIKSCANDFLLNHIDVDKKDFPLGIIFCNKELTSKVKRNKFLSYISKNVFSKIIVIESRIIPKQLFCNERSTTYSMVVFKSKKKKPEPFYLCHRTKANTHFGLTKIISGGQTGADQAGLKAGSLMGVYVGGNCPSDYLTENGPDYDLKLYNLKPTIRAGYKERTLLNVEESDGTIIFGNDKSAGSRLTKKYCDKLSKPYCVVNFPENILKYKQDFIKWIARNNIKVLNVAGNRESVTPGIFKLTVYFLVDCLANDIEVLKMAKELLKDKEV